VTLDLADTDLPRLDDVHTPTQFLLRALRPPARAALRRRMRVVVHGAEHMPKTGAVILASNHIALLDGPLMAAFSPRPVHALTKTEMFDGRLGQGLRASGQIPLHRTNVDPRGIKTCLRVLRDGHVTGIYPEGTRGTGEFLRVHGGTAYLALVSGAPIVPLVMLGSRPDGGGTNAVPEKGATVHMVYGPAIHVAPRSWPRTREQVRATSVLLHREFLAHLDRARELTGRDLPGPITDLSPDDVVATRPVSLKEHLDD
jgi:1-acyl-sn-glycerol-3-phosphate acyltransferase